jgi:hypothetical protein
MSIFGKVGHWFARAGVAFKDIFVYIPALVKKFEKVVVAEKSVESEFVKSGGVVLADLTAFLATAALAASNDCLKWNEDKAAVAAAEKLIGDSPAFLQAIEDAFAALKSE